MLRRELIQVPERLGIIVQAVDRSTPRIDREAGATLTRNKLLGSWKLRHTTSCPWTMEPERDDTATRWGTRSARVSGKWVHNGCWDDRGFRGIWDLGGVFGYLRVFAGVGRVCRLGWNQLEYVDPLNFDQDYPMGSEPLSRYLKFCSSDRRRPPIRVRVRNFMNISIINSFVLNLAIRSSRVTSNDKIRAKPLMTRENTNWS